MKGSAQTRIARPADVVWGMISDVHLMGSWSPETTSAEWIDGAIGPEVGAKFKGKNRRGLLRWTTTVRVVECEPARAFGFVVMAGSHDSTQWTYRFESTGDGGCEVTESYEVLWEPWYQKYVTPDKRRGPQLDAGIETTLARLKATAEAGR